MGCSPVQKVLNIRMPIIDCKDSPINKARQILNKKYVNELRVLEGYNDPFENYTNQVFLKETKFGSIYIVDHILTRKKRFMKIIRRAKVPKEAFTQDDLLNQIELLKHLNHPNIIQLYEVFESDDKIYMIYEYCEGGDLLDVLTSDTAFNESKCKNVMRQLFSALSYCHMKGVAHTALCPEHIVIETKQRENNDPDNNNLIVKIVDFGAFNLFSCRKELLTLGFKSIINPYFSSPELKEGFCSDKCDMWSCGVIMYLLLSGQLPFSTSKPLKTIKSPKKESRSHRNHSKDKDIKETKDIIYDDNLEKSTSKSIKSAVLKFEGEIWDSVSHEAKDLISKLLTYNPKARIDAIKALKHDFLVYDIYRDDISNKIFNEVLKNMRSFNLKYKLQKEVIGFIVHHLLNKEDIDIIRKSFMLFDKNSDGKISKDELKEGLTRIMTPIQAEIECDRILSNLKVNKNDAIEYEDFLAMAMDKEKIVNDKNLKLIFDLMDINKNGKVTKFELKNFFLGSLTTESLMADNNFFAQIINEIDANGDGEINYQEFKKMMIIKGK